MTSISTPIKSLYIISYKWLFVTLALFCPVSEIAPPSKSKPHGNLSSLTRPPLRIKLTSLNVGTLIRVILLAIHSCHGRRQTAYHDSSQTLQCNSHVGLKIGPNILLIVLLLSTIVCKIMSWRRNMFICFILVAVCLLTYLLTYWYVDEHVVAHWRLLQLFTSVAMDTGDHAITLLRGDA